MTENFFLDIIAGLQEAASKAKLNSDIKAIQKQLDKLELKAEIDPNSISGIQKKMENIKIKAQFAPDAVESLVKQIEGLENTRVILSNIGIDQGQMVKTGKQIGEGIDQGLSASLNGIRQSISNVLKEFSGNRLKSYDLSKMFNLNRAGIDSSVLKQVRDLTNEVNSLSMEILKTGADASWDGIIQKINSLSKVLNQFGKNRDLSSFKESLDVLDYFQGKKIFVGDKSEALQNTGMSVKELNNQFRNLGVTLTTVSNGSTKLDTIWTELFNISPGLQQFETFGDQLNAIVSHFKTAKEAMYGHGNLQPLNGNEVSGALAEWMGKLDEAAKKMAVLKAEEAEIEQQIARQSSSAAENVVNNEKKKQEAYQQTANAQKKVASEQIKAEKSTHSLFASFKKNFSFLSYWTSTTYVMMAAIRKIKEMVSNVHELDDALTNIAYTMDVSNSQLKQIGESSLQAAKDLHTSVSKVLDAVKTYANATETVESIIEKSKPTIMMSNVTGMDTSQTVDILQGVMEQFDLAEDQLMHISDVMQTVSMSMPYDFANGVKELSEGIKASGSVAKDAGYDLENYTALLGTLIAKTRQSGGELGRSLRTMFVRTTKASTSALANGEVSEDDLSNAEKALRRVGIEVRSDIDTFKSFDEIMGELYKKVDSLSDVDLSNIAYEVASTRQTNVFKMMIKAYGDYQEMAEQAYNADNVTIENQQKYAESLIGKLGELSAVWEKIGDDAINSSFLKGLANAGIGISSLIEKIGLLKTVIASAAITGFVKNFARP